VLTAVKAYSSWPSAPELLLNEDGRPETDLIQVRNIDGLDPVKANVSTSPRADVPGVTYTGSSTPSRNIVITIRPNPDWLNWTPDSLRKLLYQYFMPERKVRLVFESDDMAPVEISGYVESVSANQFSKDPEILVSIICPDPYFTSVDPIVLTGQAIRAGDVTYVVTYDGTIETPIVVRVDYTSGTSPTLIGIQVGNPTIAYLNTYATVNAALYFEVSSVPMQKYIQNVNLGTGVIDNLLSDVMEGSTWPILVPGDNDFSVVTDQGIQDWELTYYERFGGL
jgi:hypothetical protein